MQLNRSGIMLTFNIVTCFWVKINIDAILSKWILNICSSFSCGHKHTRQMCDKNTKTNKRNDRLISDQFVFVIFIFTQNQETKRKEF